MSEQEELRHAEIIAVRAALSGLRLTKLDAPEIRRAKMNLCDWLSDNDPNWTATAS